MMIPTCCRAIHRGQEGCSLFFRRRLGTGGNVKIPAWCVLLFFLPSLGTYLAPQTSTTKAARMAAWFAARWAFEGRFRRAQSVQTTTNRKRVVVLQEEDLMAPLTRTGTTTALSIPTIRPRTTPTPLPPVEAARMAAWFAARWAFEGRFRRAQSVQTTTVPLVGGGSAAGGGFNGAADPYRHDNRSFYSD
jgi:hypothetical protein